jgi:ribose/xylose/arabinose/galactoside ABC-type transport system permease subunit
MELLLPVWADLVSVFVFRLILFMEMLVVIAVVLAGWRFLRGWKSTWKRLCATALVAVLTAGAVSAVNLTANYVVWGYFGEQMQGKGAPFW